MTTKTFALLYLLVTIAGALIALAITPAPEPYYYCDRDFCADSLQELEYIRQQESKR